MSEQPPAASSSVDLSYLAKPIHIALHVAWFLNLVALSSSGELLLVSEVGFFFAITLMLFFYLTAMCFYAFIKHGLRREDIFPSGLSSYIPLIEVILYSFFLLMLFIASCVLASIDPLRRWLAACIFGFFTLIPLLYLWYDAYKKVRANDGLKFRNRSSNAGPPTIGAPVETGNSDLRYSGTGVDPYAIPHDALTTSDGKLKEIDYYTSIYAYSAQDEFELDFAAGVTIRVFSKEDPDWWQGQVQGNPKTGQVPSNYLKPLENPPTYADVQEPYSKPDDLAAPDPHSLTEEEYNSLNGSSWFHGRMSREEAEEVLSPVELGDGTYLIRESDNRPGTYTLSVKYQSRVSHFKVEGKYDVNGRHFDSLPAIIEVYEATPIISKSGVNTRLIKPCPKYGLATISYAMAVSTAFPLLKNDRLLRAA